MIRIKWIHMGGGFWKGEQMDPGDIAYSGDVVRVYPLVPGGRVEGSWGCYNHEKYYLPNGEEAPYYEYTVA